MTGPIRSEASRLARTTGPLADDPWATDAPAGAYALPVSTSTLPPVDTASLEPALQTMLLLERTVERMSVHAAEAADAARRDADLPSLVDLVGRLAELRRALGRTESILTVTAGRMVQEDAAPREGALPDGRQYVVRRGATRKAWDHDAWRADVRRELCSGLGTVVDTGTGETVDVPTLLAAVQAVHGSSPPKVTALRELGLTADTYCESIPGLWGVELSSPGSAE